MRIIGGIAGHPRSWRGRRTTRIVLASALVAAAPFVDHLDRADPTPTAIVAADTDPREQRRVIPIPLADPAVAEVIRPGDLIDLVGPVSEAGLPKEAGGSGSHSPPAPEPVARKAKVTGVPAGRAGQRSILIEVPEADAARVAATAAGFPLTILIHG